MLQYAARETGATFNQGNVALGACVFCSKTCRAIYSLDTFSYEPSQDNGLDHELPRPLEYCGFVTDCRWRSAVCKSYSISRWSLQDGMLQRRLVCGEDHIALQALPSQCASLGSSLCLSAVAGADLCVCSDPTLTATVWFMQIADVGFTPSW